MEKTRFIPWSFLVCVLLALYQPHCTVPTYQEYQTESSPESTTHIPDASIPQDDSISQPPDTAPTETKHLTPEPDIQPQPEKRNTPEPRPDSTNQPDNPTPPDTPAVPDAQPCTTRITYGNKWFKPPGKTSFVDVAKGWVTWDGSCTISSTGDAVATLSNGWKPAFKGKTCVIALDYSGSCRNIPTKCQTRITYGSKWKSPPNRTNAYDDVNSAISWDGTCTTSGNESFATLSNGWKPYFTGKQSCDISIRYLQCGGLFSNPVLSNNCPDPGVYKDGNTYYMVCTGGQNFPVYGSPDLIQWTFRRNAFDASSKPKWALDKFWAPEITKVGNRYILYYSAWQRSNQGFAIGVASSSKPTGPYKDIGRPLVTEPKPGVIDAHYFKDTNGQHYISWKFDGNAVKQPTPVRIQRLQPNGLGTTGTIKTILTNTPTSWEQHLIEGQWMIKRGSFYYLFYSGNAFASAAYGVGVARATSPLGPFTKKNKILGSGVSWDGPGHGSIIKGPSGDWVHVYHAWQKGKVGAPHKRLVLVDRIQWDNGWPVMRTAPSAYSQPLP